MADDLIELLLGYAVMLQERADAEKGAEKRIALHAKLQFGLVGRFTRDVEPGKDENADIVFLHEPAVMRGNALPGCFRSVARFPYERTAFVEPFQWIGVREGFRIATENHIHVVQLAIDPNALRGDDEIIICGCAL